MQCVIDGGPLERSSRYDFKSPMFRSIYSDEHIFKCSQCGLRQVNVKAVDNAMLSEYYRGYYRNVARINARTTEGRKAYLAARGKALAGAVPLGAPRRGFELGSGFGYNLVALRERFPEIELSTDELDQTMTPLPGVRIATLEDGPYDVIIFSHVLEHFTDPLGLLDRAYDALAPGGALILEVPNDIEGIYPINGPDEPHLTFFTTDSLSLLLGRTRFSVVDLFTAGRDHKYRDFKTRLKKAYWRARRRLTGPAKTPPPGRAAPLIGQRNPNGSVIRAVLLRQPAV